MTGIQAILVMGAMAGLAAALETTPLDIGSIEAIKHLSISGLLILFCGYLIKQIAKTHAELTASHKEQLESQKEEKKQVAKMVNEVIEVVKQNTEESTKTSETLRSATSVLAGLQKEVISCRAEHKG